MPSPYLESRRDYNNPKDASDDWQVRLESARLAFKHGLISCDVFKAKLHGMGFRGAELETEVNLNFPTGG